MSFARRVKRNIERKENPMPDEFVPGAHIPDNHLKLPVGTVLSDPIKGEFIALPIFGWICRRVKSNTPLVMITTILLGLDEDPVPKGTLQIEMPVYPDTEYDTLAALESFGWDGRVWPEDKGWPEGDLAAEEQLKALMDQAKLTSTLTFPAYDSGYQAQKVSVSRAHGPFLMPPLPKCEGEPNIDKLVRFRQLCDASAFLFLRKHT